MSAKRFVDTNVLLYAVSQAPDEAAKAQRALALLDDEHCVLSVQVLQEFYVQATRPSRADRLSHEQAVALIESWMRFPVQEVTVAVMRAALAACVRFRIAYWDAAIIEAARAAGCREVYSEDLNANQDFDGVRVVSPFASPAPDR
jgi:predicted nucleic acid-binding protein